MIQDPVFMMIGNYVCVCIYVYTYIYVSTHNHTHTQINRFMESHSHMNKQISTVHAFGH